jgi:hypothetical protein
MLSGNKPGVLLSLCFLIMVPHWVFAQTSKSSDVFIVLLSVFFGRSASIATGLSQWMKKLPEKLQSTTTG